MIAAANLPALTRDVDFVSDGIFAGVRAAHLPRRTHPLCGRQRTETKLSRIGGSALLGNLALQVPEKEMGAGIAASPHCAERRICRCS
jgi:hypothetical protein